MSDNAFGRHRRLLFTVAYEMMPRQEAGV